MPKSMTPKYLKNKKKLALESKPTQNSQSNDSPKTSFLVSLEQKRKFLDLLKLKEYELTHLCRSLGSTY